MYVQHKAVPCLLLPYSIDPVPNNFNLDLFCPYIENRTHLHQIKGNY